MSKRGKKKAAMTAEEFVRQLEQDPEHQAKRARLQHEQEERVASWRAEQTGLLAELRSIGIEAESVWDVSPEHPKYNKAIPILLEHLARPYSERIAEGIGRALGGAPLDSYWERLCLEYEKVEEDRAKGAKMGLAASLVKLASDEVYDDIARLVSDPWHGETRVALVACLGHMKKRAADAESLLELLCSDETVGKQAAVELARIRQRKQ